MVFCGCAACPYDPRIFKFSMDVLASLLILFNHGLASMTVRVSNFSIDALASLLTLLGRTIAAMSVRALIFRRMRLLVCALCLLTQSPQ